MTGVGSVKFCMLCVFKWLFFACLQEQDVLEEIIGKLLNLGKLQEAQQLVNLFEYNSQELALVLVSV